MARFFYPIYETMVRVIRKTKLIPGRICVILLLMIIVKYILLFFLLFTVISCAINSDKINIRIFNGFVFKQGSAIQLNCEITHNNIDIILNSFPENIINAFSINNFEIISYKYFTYRPDKIYIILNKNIDHLDDSILYLNIDLDYKIENIKISDDNYSIQFHEEQEDVIPLYNQFYIYCPYYDETMFTVYLQITNSYSKLYAERVNTIPFINYEDIVNVNSYFYISLQHRDTYEKKYITKEGILYDDVVIYDINTYFYPGNYVDLSHLDFQSF